MQILFLFLEYAEDIKITIINRKRVPEIVPEKVPENQRKTLQQ